MAEEAEFIEAQEAIIYRVLDNVSTVFPARVIAPSNIEGLVDVQPNHKFKVVGSNEELTPEPINNVIFMYPGRTQKTNIRPPKEALIGSKVLVLACEHDITEWRSSGGKTIYPGENRRFNFNDAVAIPGLYPETVKWPNPQKPNTFEFLGVEGVKFHIGSSTADMLKIMYDFLDFFQTVGAGSGDAFAANLTAAQPALLASLKTLMESITNI